MKRSLFVGDVEHCDNFDGNYEGCRTCPGILRYTRGGERFEECRAGQALARQQMQETLTRRETPENEHGAI